MNRTINIGSPELGFGSYGIAKVQVEIQEDGISVSTRLYYFNINQFSAFCDSTNTLFGSIHFGTNDIAISNGEYNEVYYNGALVESPYTVIYEIAEAIAQLTP